MWKGEVFFGDLDGDGFLEMVVGWSIYTVRDKQMTLYSLAGNRLTKWYEGMYSSAVMTDMTGKGRDDLLLLQASSGDHPRPPCCGALKKRGWRKRC